jgi:hypothetical protein
MGGRRSALLRWPTRVRASGGFASCMHATCRPSVVRASAPPKRSRPVDGREGNQAACDRGAPEPRCPSGPDHDSADMHGMASKPIRTVGKEVLRLKATLYRPALLGCRRIVLGQRPGDQRSSSAERDGADQVGRARPPPTGPPPVSWAKAGQLKGNAQMHDPEQNRPCDKPHPSRYPAAHGLARPS